MKLPKPGKNFKIFKEIDKSGKTEYYIKLIYGKYSTIMGASNQEVALWKAWKKLKKQKKSNNKTRL